MLRQFRWLLCSFEAVRARSPPRPSMIDAEQYFSADSSTARSHLVLGQALAGDDEMQVNVGEDLRVGIGTLALDLDHAVRHAAGAPS